MGPAPGVPLSQPPEKYTDESTLFIHQPTSRRTHKSKLCSILINLQTYSTLSLSLLLSVSISLVACWKSVSVSVKLLLSESEAHGTFDNFSSLISIFFSILLGRSEFASWGLVVFVRDGKMLFSKVP